MSSRKRKKQIEEMAARACARLAEERRPYKEIYELMENGSDEELAARIDRAAAEGSDILHYLDEYGFQLIHSAARMNRAAAVAPLVRAGFGVNDKGGEGGRTPIHIAAAHGTAEAAQELVALGAVPYEPPGSQALFDAFERCVDKSSGYLLKQHGAVVPGKNLMDAFYSLEELEESAKITWMLRKGA